MAKVTSHTRQDGTVEKTTTRSNAHIGGPVRVDIYDPSGGRSWATGNNVDDVRTRAREIDSKNRK